MGFGGRFLEVGFLYECRSHEAGNVGWRRIGSPLGTLDVKVCCVCLKSSAVVPRDTWYSGRRWTHPVCPCVVSCVRGQVSLSLLTFDKCLNRTDYSCWCSLPCAVTDDDRTKRGLQGEGFRQEVSRAEPALRVRTCYNDEKENRLRTYC